MPYDGLWILVVDTDLFGIFRVGRVSILDNPQAIATVDASREEAKPKELKEA